MLFGVAEGVVCGVESALLPPTRRRFPGRGVALAARYGLFEGVRSSGAGVWRRGVLVGVLRADREGCVAPAAAWSEGARRGTRGVFAVRVVASVGFSGRPVLLVVERSVGILRLGV